MLSLRHDDDRKPVEEDDGRGQDEEVAPCRHDRPAVVEVDAEEGADLRRQVAQTDLRRAGQGEGALQNMLQLADIARIVVLGQLMQGLVVEAGFAVVFGEQKGDQRRKGQIALASEILRFTPSSFEESYALNKLGKPR